LILQIQCLAHFVFRHVEANALLDQLLNPSNGFVVERLHTAGTNHIHFSFNEWICAALRLVVDRLSASSMLTQARVVPKSEHSAPNNDKTKISNKSDYNTQQSKPYNLVYQFLVFARIHLLRKEESPPTKYRLSFFFKHRRKEIKRMSDQQMRIASLLIGLTSQDADERKDATRELLDMTDDLEKVPLVVSSANLTAALVLMREQKDYYRYIGVEVLMRIWKLGKLRAEIRTHKDFILGTVEHLLANYDVLSATRIDAMRVMAADLRKPPTANEASEATSSTTAATATAAVAATAAPSEAATSAPTKEHSSRSKHHRSEHNKRSSSKTTTTSSPSSSSSIATTGAAATTPVVRIAIDPHSGYNPAALLAALTPRDDADKGSAPVSAERKKSLASDDE
jgi:hypothetical protein